MQRYDPESDAELTASMLSRRAIYIAAPFFNDMQVEEVELVKCMLDRTALNYFSPKDECRYKPGDDLIVAQRAHYLNLHHIKNCRLLIAILTYPDTGTAWEMAWAQGHGKPRLGVTNNPKVGMNLMVRMTVDAIVPLSEFGSVVDALEIDMARGRSPLLAVPRVDYGFDYWKGVIE